MSENIQVLILFCLTVVSAIGIISAVICRSRDKISFNVKSRIKLPNQSESNFDIEIHKDAEKKN